MLNEEIDIYQCDDLKYLLTNGPDYISRYLREGKIWEELNLKISKAFTEDIPQPVLVDIGANLGAWSVPMGAHIHPHGGTIHCFEPQRPVFYQLCANLLCNNLMNCHAYNMAVGDYTGYTQIPLLDIYHCHNLGALSLSESIRKEQGWIKDVQASEQVRIITLDDMQLPAADLVKIDVEGLEFEVLKGGKNWLKQSGCPPIIFEVWGDYMKGMIAKKKRLIHFLREEMDYELVFVGESCFAQHRDKMKINVGELVK